MICYRDMTFCPYWRDCANAGECHRPLTDEVVEAAKKWWGSESVKGPPISIFMEKPDCWSEK